MTHHQHPAAVSGMDCDAFKATLSAYIDDELARSERFQADTHLIACANCRGLVERAEEMDRTLREEFAADLEDVGDAVNAAIEAAGSAAMEAAVFARIGAENRRRWMPRVAIAAAVVAVVGVGVVLLRAAESPQPLAPAGVGVFARSTSAQPSALAPVARPTTQATLLAALSPDDRQALYATSVLLGAARKTAFGDLARRSELRETARYDELVDRLNEVLPKLPAEERAAVALARDATERIVSNSESAEDWQRIQEDVAVQSLDRHVDELSDLAQ
ncbi:MAG: zf-HC2 domain-containing protein [Limnohabitans sp.]|nr:zf-HC2 domain-containing protein [Limnohabitans sp.]